MMEMSPDVSVVVEVGWLLILGREPIDRLIVDVGMIFLSVVVSAKLSIENAVLVEGMVMKVMVMANPVPMMMACVS